MHQYENPACGQIIIYKKTTSAEIYLLKEEEQDWNSTYRCALEGLRIYNLFNLFSLLI